jgi:NAD(P)-dependent dehydrogenase (short-subunit alcohol dehydrogenase family)
MIRWTAADIPNQAGKTAVVTGANSGIGFHTALGLARAGARVVVAVRDEVKGKAAIRRLRAAVPDADLHMGLLDLADLGSIQRFAAQVLDSTGPLDLLVNSAGVMGVPQRLTTRDGFELHFGTNHLGHFALTGLLLPGLLTRPGARVVTVSSIAHEQGQIRFDDLQGEQSYGPWTAYSQFKLANLLFAFELDRQARDAGWTSQRGSSPGRIGDESADCWAAARTPRPSDALPPVLRTSDRTVGCTRSIAYPVRRNRAGGCRRRLLRAERPRTVAR